MVVENTQNCGIQILECFESFLGWNMKMEMWGEVAEAFGYWHDSYSTIRNMFFLFQIL